MPSRNEGTATRSIAWNCDAEACCAVRHPTLWQVPPEYESRGKQHLIFRLHPSNQRDSWNPGISDIGVSVVAGRSSAPKNLLKVSHSMVSACHGSRILLALDRHVRNPVLAERFGARPTGLFGPRCRFAAVEAPKLSDRAGPTRDRLPDYNM